MPAELAAEASTQRKVTDEPLVMERLLIVDEIDVRFAVALPSRAAAVPVTGVVKSSAVTDVQLPVPRALMPS